MSMICAMQTVKENIKFHVSKNSNCLKKVVYAPEKLLWIVSKNQ